MQTLSSASSISVVSGSILDELIAGQVVAVNKNLMNDVNPCPAGGCVYSGSSGQGAVIGAWNSGVYAEHYGTFGAMIYRGGGDGDYWGNETYAFELDTQLFKRITEPSTNLDPVVGVEAEYADGRPGSPHSYDAYEYLTPSEGGGPKGTLLSVKNTFVKTVNSSGRAHFIDLDSKAEGRYSTNRAALMSSHLPTVCKDTLRGRFLMTYLNNSDGRVFSLPMDTKTWVQLPGGSPIPQGYSAGDYFPDGDLWIILTYRATTSSMALLAINPANTATRRWLNTDVTVPGSLNAGGMCYGNGKLFIRHGTAGTQQSLWIAHPPADPWNGTWQIEHIVMPGVSVSAQSHVSDFHGIYKRMRWASKIGAVVWCSGNKLPVYAYKP